MEDYTYHFEKGNEIGLRAHMLEVCPIIAAGKPHLKVHRLGIGDKEDPAHLVFTGMARPAICTAVVDFGSCFRYILNEVNVVTPPKDLPKLPVARALWKHESNLRISAESWILAGGRYHTAYSNIVTTDMIRYWAEMVSIECVVIDKNTNVVYFRNKLRWNATASRK